MSRSRSRQPVGSLCELRELTYRYHTKLDPDGNVVWVPRVLGRCEAVAAVLSQLLEDEAVEVFGVLCLTTRRTLICWHEVSRGGLDGTSFQMRDLFRSAVLANADAVIVAHNHPSGDPDPSAVDLQLTTAIRQAGAALHIDVLDHFIVGCGRSISLRREYPMLFGGQNRPRNSLAGPVQRGVA